MNSPYRITQTSSFGPTLESESLPVLGQDRHAGRARAWQRIMIALGGFWAVALVSLIIAAWF